MDRYKFLKGREGVKGINARKVCLANERKDKRLKLLEDLRARETEATENPPIAVEKRKKSRLELLKEWKLEKAQKENQLKKAKKPPFYAGKMQKKATGSPMLVPATATSGRSGAITRSQAKANNIQIVKPVETARKRKQPPQSMMLDRLNKVEKNVLKPVENHPFVLPKVVTDLHKLTIPQSPKIKKSARKSVKPLFESIKKESEANAMVYNTLDENELRAPKAKRRLTVQELLHANEKVLEPLKTTSEQTSEPSKSTENANQEPSCKQATIEKMDYSPDQNPLPINNFQHMNYSPFVEKTRGNNKIRRSSKKSMTLSEKVDAEIAEEEAAFKGKIASCRLFLANETTRLLGLAETWVNYLQHQPNLPSEVEGDINAVAGKTKLLTSDKFKQFEGLINKCENGDPMIKADDLLGFHDWVSLEIEDLDKVFSKLEERKKNDWVVEAPKIKKVLKKKPVSCVAPKRVITSSLRDVIMAQRIKKQTDLPGPSPPASPRGTPKDRSNLRIQVLQRSSGLAVLAATAAARASLSPSKSPEVEKYTTPSSPFTPGKSILKTTPTALSEKKSVIFGSLESKELLPVEDSSFRLKELSSPLDSLLKKTPASPPKKTAGTLGVLYKKCLLSIEDSSDDSPIGLALVDSPLKIATGELMGQTKIMTPEYLRPSQDDSTDDLSTPPIMQMRRSTRIARKSGKL